MRIGIDARLWNETGVGRYIRNLVENLAEIDKKNQYILFVRSKDKERITNYVSSNTWKVVTADVRWHSIKEQLRLPSILEKDKPNLVHFPYFSVPISYSGKFVVTIHDLIIHHFDTGRATTFPLLFYKAKRLGYKLVMRKVAKKTSKIIAVSNATREEVVKYLRVNPDKVVVTYEGVDDALRSKFNPPSGGQSSKLKSPYFLYVGNAYPHKNLERLVDAFNLLIRNTKYVIQNTKLVLVGKEDYFYKGLKERVKELGLLEHVVFHGEATDEELMRLYQYAKALIIPSLIEGFGLPALEAMANRCLVLASDIPALRETCNEAAVYFNPYDIGDMKEKMGRALNDANHFTQNIERGFERAKEFSWKKMAQQTLDVYREVAISS